ncbi:MAG: hypothetical protein QHJ73_17565, partial [Armatimonadota bacterium]|nr:hypothetical protein [Armatimonadota bacterium]
HPGSGEFRMREGSTEAMARAFANAEKEWRVFYRNHLLTGDPRFVVTRGTVGTSQCVLRVRNLGRKQGERIQGEVRFAAPGL